jgi:peptidoglycan/LPS O-acetylase OafA/YrhL
VKRIPEFEALRGFLAVWVLVGHALLLSGYESSDLGGLRVLAFPVFAVDVFIILSGFVIFSLLDHKDEGYGPFIIRRFFRLFPLFIVVIALSASLAGFTQHQLETFPWQTQQIVLSARFAKDTIDYLPWQVAVHLTMLHGLVPPWLLPSSTYALIPPAWSVSVEWQFYLVAPLLFGLLRKSVAAISGLLVGTVIVGVIVGVILHRQHSTGQGLAITQAAYFLIGICCYFLFKNAHRLSSPIIWLGVTVTAAVTVPLLAKGAIPLIVWSVFLAAALQAERGETNPISAVCGMRVAQFSGRISYSVYLWHWLVIALVSSALISFLPQLTQERHAELLIPITVLLTIFISALSFFFIEKPGMAGGQRLADAIAQRSKRGVALGGRRGPRDQIASRTESGGLS